MKTRTKQHRPQETTYESYEMFEDQVDLDSLSEEELEALLFEEEQKESSSGLFNLPNMAGLSMIVVGIAYLFQKLGLLAGDLSALASMLPIIAGILIILLGFGVLSWRPSRKKKKTVKKTVKVKSGKEVRLESGTKDKEKKRLRKSRDKKIAGVAGGLAEYFNIDPTLVRIAFVIGTIISQGTFLFAYLILSFVMAKPEPLSLSRDEKITIIRDS
ncbi:MAG TPA: PspC domain-containing protein [Rhodothermales bacterium]|nr:PspC domain-containing protein [Rhodothermales bacterium]